MNNEQKSEATFLKATDIDIDWIPTHEIVAGLMVGGKGLRIPDTYEDEARDIVKQLRRGSGLTNQQMIALFLHEILQRDVMIGKLAEAMGAPSALDPNPPAPPPDEPSRILTPDNRLVVVR